MSTDPLRIAAARLVLELSVREELPAVAVRAMQEGIEPQSMILLAGLSRSEMDEARPLFEAALAELGRTLPGRWESVMILAREEARAILSGTVSPYEGATKIWDLFLLAHHEGTHELDTFIFGASEWEGRPEDRGIFEEGILLAAAELVDAPERP